MKQLLLLTWRIFPLQKKVAAEPSFWPGHQLLPGPAELCFLLLAGLRPGFLFLSQPPGYQ